MSPEYIIQTLIDEWHALQRALGDDWGVFRDRLTPLIQQLPTARGARQRKLLADQILEEISRHPVALQMFPAEGQARAPATAQPPRAKSAPARDGSPPTDGPISTRGATRSAAPPAMRETPASSRSELRDDAMRAEPSPKSFPALAERAAGLADPRRLTRYTDIDCPRRVWYRTPRVSVVVRLTLGPSKQSTAIEALEVQAGLPIEVYVDAPAFNLLSDEMQTMLVPDDRASEPVVFELEPRDVGSTHVKLDFIQERNLLGSASVPIECVAWEVSPQASAYSGPPVQWETDAEPPDILLHIIWHQSPQAGPSSLQFRLWDGKTQRSFPPVPIASRPEAYVNEQYCQLTGVTRRIDPVAMSQFSVTDEQKALEPWYEGSNADRRVKGFGQLLWRDLIPPEFKQYYAEHRDDWDQRSLLLVSDDPYLPWELLWPYASGGWEDDVPWCMRMRMTRWLRTNSRDGANLPPPATLHLGKMAVLAPTSYGLIPAAYLHTAQSEREYLRGLMERYRLRDSSPPLPTWDGVMDLLEAGDYDWFHVATHGKFHTATPNEGASVLLQGGQALTPNHLVGPSIEGHLANRRPAFFLNACEVGRLSLGLTTQQAGWATRLIGAGAGLFVGPQWEVTDDGAYSFVEEVYRRLLRGDTVGEATQQARLAAKREGDPTCLGYCVYAHPNARVALEA